MTLGCTLTFPTEQKTNSMKSTSKRLVSLVALSLAALTGCKNLTPQGAAALTTGAVYAFGRNNPHIIEKMRQIQPLACDMAKNPSSTVEDVVGIIQNAAGVDTDTKAVLNVLLAIYQTSIYNVGTNQPQTHPYLEAVICPGWSGGLSLLPAVSESGARSTAQPHPAGFRNWILIE